MATLFSVLVLPAIVFAAVYPSLLNRLSRGLVSSYVKADVRRRLCAGGVDALLVVSLLVLSGISQSLIYFGLGAAYLLLRDALAGQSVGKLLFSVSVIDLTSGRPASLSHSVKRNVVWLLPGANIAAVYLEGRAILTERQGQRLGDRFAQTQVVEGSGASDLVTTLQQWLVHMGRALAQASGQRRPEIERIDRAA